MRFLAWRLLFRKDMAFLRWSLPHAPILNSQVHKIVWLVVLDLGIALQHS